MANQTDGFTKNPFVDKMMKLIPDHPLTQAHYMYVLTAVTFFGIIGYGLVGWYQFFTSPFNLKILFSALFMTAVGLMTTFGLKATRTAYLTQKVIWTQIAKDKAEKKDAQEQKEESVDDMMAGFKDAK